VTVTATPVPPPPVAAPPAASPPPPTPPAAAAAAPPPPTPAPPPAAAPQAPAAPARCQGFHYWRVDWEHGQPGPNGVVEYPHVCQSCGVAVRAADIGEAARKAAALGA
jgi:hypothetical protein